MRSRLAAAVFTAALAVGSMAQQPQLNNQSILKMHDAGMSDDLIVTTINAQAGVYSTTTDDLIALKKAGITETVITAMVVKGSAPTAPALTASSSGLRAASPPAPVTEAPGKPRVFLMSNSHGPSQNAARDQSMEMSKDVEKFCPAIRVTLNQQMADYTLSLNHIEVGLLIRDNQFQIADKNGDLISRTKEGGSIAAGVKKACDAILANWDTARPSTPAGSE